MKAKRIKVERKAGRMSVHSSDRKVKRLAKWLRENVRDRRSKRLHRPWLHIGGEYTIFSDGTMAVVLRGKHARRKMPALDAILDSFKIGSGGECLPVERIKTFKELNQILGRYKVRPADWRVLRKLPDCNILPPENTQQYGRVIGFSFLYGYGFVYASLDL